MKKFYVTFVKSFTLEIEAKNEEDAEDRAEMLADEPGKIDSLASENSFWEVSDVEWDDDSDEDED